MAFCEQIFDDGIAGYLDMDSTPYDTMSLSPPTVPDFGLEDKSLLFGLEDLPQADHAPSLGTAYLPSPVSGNDTPSVSPLDDMFCCCMLDASWFSCAPANLCLLTPPPNTTCGATFHAPYRFAFGVRTWIPVWQWYERLDVWHAPVPTGAPGPVHWRLWERLNARVR